MSRPKRKATSVPDTAETKRVRIADHTTKLENNTTDTRRPERTSVGEPKYNLARSYTRKLAYGHTQDAKTAVDSDTPKKRGRPSKKTAVTASPEPTKRGRGRPRLAPVANETTAKKVEQESAAINPKKRGRPSLKPDSDTKKSPAAKSSGKSDTILALKSADEPAKRGRGRPPKGMHTDKDLVARSSRDLTAPTKRGRGRPSKISSTEGQLSTGMSEVESSSADDLDAEANDEGNDSRQFWLMKAEPNDRFENGHNVKFSIDDLAAATEPEKWDGVRNYSARNNMRAMRKGDLAFFYHSNCTNPGVVGAMRIVKEHSVDESAFDPGHPYYDPKSSREAPKWDIVHVEFVKRFDNPITLKALQKLAVTDANVAEMQVLRLKRLSVTAVTPSQWETLLAFAKEELSLGNENSTNVQSADDKEDDHFSDADDIIHGSKGMNGVSHMDIQVSGEKDNEHHLVVDGNGEADGIDASVSSRSHSNVAESVEA